MVTNSTKYINSIGARSGSPPTRSQSIQKRKRKMCIGRGCWRHGTILAHLFHGNGGGVIEVKYKVFVNDGTKV